MQYITGRIKKEYMHKSWDGLFKSYSSRYSFSEYVVWIIKYSASILVWHLLLFKYNNQLNIKYLFSIRKKVWVFVNGEEGISLHLKKEWGVKVHLILISYVLRKCDWLVFHLKIKYIFYS